MSTATAATTALIQSKTARDDLNKQKKEELERKLEVIQKELNFKASSTTQSGQKKSKKGKTSVCLSVCLSVWCFEILNF